MNDGIDGCELDFSEAPTSDKEVEWLLEELATDEERKANRGGDDAAASVAGFDLTLADRLRREGLTVVEVPGWRTRSNGNPLRPRGAVTHHTAGPRPTPTSRAPSLGIIIRGRPDLSGPLANTYIDYDGKVYVIAAGTANHAGLPDRGAVPWASGNSSAWGLEVEHPGTFALDAKRAEIAARVQAATIRNTATADRVVYHKEWAPSRKIDLATAPAPGIHRAAVARILGQAPKEDPVIDEETIKKLERLLDDLHAGKRLPALPEQERLVFWFAAEQYQQGKKSGSDPACAQKLAQIHELSAPPG